MDTKKLTEINEKIVQLVKGIHVLPVISWPLSSEQEFLLSWEKKNPKLPKIEYTKVSHKEKICELEKLSSSFTAEHPLEIFTKKTIASYIAAAKMVEAVGTSEFQKLSIEIYGEPGDITVGSSLTHGDVAEKILNISKNFTHSYIKEPELCELAQTIAAYLKERVTETFGNKGPNVELNDKISAKATAGARLVKIRPGSSFNRYDAKQLLVHEIMTHSLTAINGLNQKILKVLGWGAPRTTGTQEGLATFSEVITGAIDLRRLSRLALRVVAIDYALRGADFIDLFKLFLENGNSEKESYWSAARIFRGGYPDKHIIFTKDGVYIDGLIKVHALFRWALMSKRLSLTHLLFCGRVTIEDLFLLESSYAEGLIEAPEFLPEWYERIESLAGILSFSQIAGAVDEDGIERYFEKLKN